MANPDEKMDFLAFTRRITTHYLKAAKLRRSCRRILFTQVKDRGKGMQSFQLMRVKKANILPKHARRNVVECVPKGQERGALYAKLDYAWSRASKLFIWANTNFRIA